MKTKRGLAASTASISAVITLPLPSPRLKQKQPLRKEETRHLK
jgi:hypothetical protein